MAEQLPESAQKLIDQPYCGTIATLEPDGQPQLTVVWLTHDGENVLISTAKGRRKPANLNRDPRASVMLIDPQDPWHTVEVRGRAELIDDPEGKLIQQLSQKYMGKPYTFDPPGTERVIIKIVPERVRFMGGRPAGR